MLLRFLAFAGLNILFGYNRTKFTADYTLYGWLALANGGLTLLLAARGTNLLSTVLRVPTPLLLTYHRWCGMASLVHATVHLAYTVAHNARTGQLSRVLQNDVYQAGLVAWSALAVLFLTSLRPVRRWCWELFYYPHYLFLVFAAGALYHALHAKEFFLPGLALWFIDRVWRLRHWFSKTEAEVTHLDGDVTKFAIKGVSAKAGAQMAWVQFPVLSRMVWHPFTLVTTPERGSAFAIRGLGGYTKKVQALDGRHSSDKPSGSSAIPIRIDGPHGVGGIKWGHHAVTVLVAGGIGITPGISIATSIISQSTDPSSPFSSADAPARHIHLLWTLRSLSHASWFTDELSRLSALAESSGGKVTIDITIHYTAAGPSLDHHGIEAIEATEEALTGSPSPGYTGPGTLLQGRPDMLAWFMQIRDQRPNVDIAVNACGSRQFLESARKAAANASCSGGLFQVEEEVFEF
jgi:predicted ferric reductase